MTSQPADPDGPDVDSAETNTEDSVGEATTAEKPWWDNPAFPWRGKPTKADLGCMWAIAGLGVYGLVMLPLRPTLFAISPYVTAVVNGGAVSMIRIGANVSTYHDPTWMWVLGLLVATISLIKFDWIFWWAGRLWGDRLIDYLLQNRGGLAKRNAQRAQRLTHKYDVLAMAITYIPFIPFPSAIVYGALGISGTSLRKFLLLNGTLALISRSIYLYVGYRIGEPAAQLFQQIDKYAMYVSLALVVGVLVLSFWRSSRKKNAESTSDAEAAESAQADRDQTPNAG